jgi:hypothetical protein
MFSFIADTAVVISNTVNHRMERARIGGPVLIVSARYLWGDMVRVAEPPGNMGHRELPHPGSSPDSSIQSPP